MSIDPKRIEEWRARLAAKRGGVEPIPGGNGAVWCTRCRAVLMPGTEAYDWHGESPAHACEPVFAIAREAVPALLSEREEMQREIEALRAGAPVKAYARSDEALRDVSATCLAWEARAKKAEAAADLALSVLRSVEWAGAPGLAYQRCPMCDGMKPVHFDLWLDDLKREEILEQADARVSRGHAEGCALAALLRGTP